MSTRRGQATWHALIVAATLAAMSIATTEPGSRDALSGPRVRRRVRTKLMIQAEALRLFAQHGYEQTTIEQIAEAADISTRTYFRYFPTKEDVVVWDEWDDQTAELLAAHTGDRPVAQTLYAASRAILEGVYTNDPERLLVRLRVRASVPAIRARYLELTCTAAEQIAATMASDPADQNETLCLRVTAAAIIDIADVALDQWQKDDGKSDLLALYDTITTALIDGLNSLQTPARRRATRTPSRS